MVDKICKICGDRAPRNYYGVTACDGCKSFFRRAVRGNQVYVCRFQRNCTVSKDKRTQCRYCRLRKCLRVGMKKEAVQNDRDPIRYRRPSAEDSNSNNSNTLTMRSLIQADELVKEAAKCTEEYINGLRTKGVATSVNDYHNSAKEQLQVMVKWAKSIPAFCDLAQEDKVALLKANAGEYIILGLVRRSLQLSEALLMGTGFLLTRESGDVLGVTCRIMDELVEPMRRLKLDDIEFACLKGIVFFDPSARGLSEPRRIESLRYQAQLSLEVYISDRQLEEAGRFGDMLLRLLSLQSIAQSMSEEMQLRSLFGLAHIDKLLREMLLGEGDDSLYNNFAWKTLSKPLLAAKNFTQTCSCLSVHSEMKVEQDGTGDPSISSTEEN